VEAYQIFVTYHTVPNFLKQRHHATHHILTRYSSEIVSWQSRHVMVFLCGTNISRHSSRSIDVSHALKNPSAAGV
jgi:hypothetical protein